MTKPILIDDLVDTINAATKPEDLDILFDISIIESTDDTGDKLQIIRNKILLISKLYNLGTDNKYTRRHFTIKQKYCSHLLSFSELYYLKTKHAQKNNKTEESLIDSLIQSKLKKFYKMQENPKKFRTLSEICNIILNATCVKDLYFLRDTQVQPYPCDESLLRDAIDKIYNICDIISVSFKSQCIIAFLNMIYFIYPSFSYVSLKRKRKIDEAEKTDLKCPFLIRSKPFTLCDKKLEQDHIACKNHVAFFKIEYNGFSSVFSDENLSAKRLKIDEVD